MQDPPAGVPEEIGALAAGSIVVGYDGSSSGDQALRWAIRESEFRRLPVHVIHVVQWPVTVVPGDAGWLSSEQRALIAKNIDEAIAAAGGAQVQVSTQVSIVEGSVVGTLCDCSDRASMVVLGARGHGGFSGLLIGSVGLAVAVHAHCPVIVVRGTERGTEHRTEQGAEDAGLPEPPIVVGVDDSPYAAAAVEFAFAEAAVRGCAVVAVRAWHPPSGVRDPDEIETAEHHALRQVLDQHRTRYPDVGVSTRLVPGAAAPMLIEWSRQAQLIVVGSRGEGGFAGLLLGSVSQQLLHHAECPVAIIR